MPFFVFVPVPSMDAKVNPCPHSSEEEKWPLILTQCASQSTKQALRALTLTGTVFVHIDNVICQNGWKVTAQISDAKPESLTRPPYSPDLSPVT
jgi:hypothetical protein